MRLTRDQLGELIDNSRPDPRGANLRGKCPKCGQYEFGIALAENHQFGCYRKRACGFTGNIFTLLAYLGRLQEYLEGAGYHRKPTLENRIHQDEVELNLDMEVIKPPTGWSRVYDHTYLNNRGFSPKDYNKYEVGVSKLHKVLHRGYVCFLLYRFQDLVGYVGRSVKTKGELLEYEKRSGKKMLRYYNCPTTEFSRLLLGYNEITENTTMIILVEGLFDKKNVDDQLQLDQQEQIKCLCTFKAHVSVEQRFLIEQFPGIDTAILFYDPDVIGDIKTTGSELQRSVESVYIAFGDDENLDPGDMTRTQIEYTLENYYGVEQFQHSKIQKRKLI